MKIVVGLIAFLAILFLILNLFTNLDKKDKLKVLYLFIAVSIVACIYESFQTNQGDKNREVVLNFIQNKPILCKEIKVDSENFNFVSGTLTFIGKNIDNKNTVFQVDECKIEEK